MLRRSTAFFLIAALLSACSTAVKVQNNKDTGVVLIGSGDAQWSRLDEILEQDDDFKKDRNEPLDTAIGNACTNKEIKAEAAAVGLLAPIVISIVLNQVDKALQEQLKQYTATYGAENTMANFYPGLPKDQNEDPSTSSEDIKAEDIKGRFRCIRFWRNVKGKNDEVAMDFIAALRMTGRRDGIQIQPLRLFLSQPVALYEDEVAVSIAMKGNAVWRDNHIGKSAPVFDLTVLTQKMTLEGNNRKTVTYPFKDEEKGVDLNTSDNEWPRVPIWPMVSWSSMLKKTDDRGNLNYQVTVAEVGKVPSGLQAMADIISKNKGKIGGQLEKAVAELLEDE